MNQQQAIELATEHGITVSTDKVTKEYVSFKVGKLTVVRAPRHTTWCISNPNGGALCYPSGPNVGKTIKLKRGDAIQFAVEMTLGLELTAYAKAQ